MGEQQTILIADDDPQIRSMLSFRLTSLGFIVIQAKDGAEALQQARDQKPDLILLDVMMPHMNGWEVARAVRQDPALGDVAIVMLTAIGAHINELTSTKYAVDDYVDKPFEFSALEKKIRAVLASRNG
jgi:DNA-binding response OmpR family regulator